MITAWHFCLPGDPPNIGKLSITGEPVNPGTVVKASGALKLCSNGCHASIRAIDALQYAQGPIVSRVELSGDEIIKDTDKLCAHERKHVWMADATRVLHEFACWCAEQALLKEREAGREPDKRCWQAIEAKRQWLDGKLTDDVLSAARSAARSAAWSSAAWSAAWSAARSAARSAAWSSAAWSAAWSAQNTELERRLYELGGCAI